MPQMVRLRCPWSGPAVTGPGVSTFYFSTSGSGVPAAVKAFFQSFALALPTGLTITVPNDGDLIDDATGALVGTWSEPSGGGTVTGGTGGSYAQGVGMQVRWVTSGIVNRRKVIGSTFIVPVVSAVYSADGTLADATVTANRNAGTQLITAQPTFRVWSRPKAGRPGSSSPVIACQAPDRVSWLRSRRT